MFDVNLSYNLGLIPGPRPHTVRALAFIIMQFGPLFQCSGQWSKGLVEKVKTLS